MREIRVIKSLERLTNKQIPVDDRRAVTDFRAFGLIGDLHAERVTDNDALTVMLEVVDGVRNTLLQRQENAIYKQG